MSGEYVARVSGVYASFTIVTTLSIRLLSPGCLLIVYVQVVSAFVEGFREKGAEGNHGALNAE
jgi:hypothetical protein